MAIYSNLSYGSSGSEVKKLQESLMNAGYDLGDTGADGQFGAKTKAAVVKYQSDNGLAVDGIAGSNTLGKLYSTASTSTNATTSTNTGTTTNTPSTEQAASPSTTPDYSKYQYDASSDAAYQQALQALQQASKETPSYAGTYDDKLDQIYQQITNREKFKYDLNSDMLYQQYKDQYTNLGQLAMKDTMGQAAALTGGYGSSYGQSVGQQQYDAYLQQLNEVVPELYNIARDQYQQEGDDLYQQYAMTGDMADQEYGRYQDSLDRYWQNVDYLTGRADTEYNKGYNNWYNAYQMGTEEQNTAYARLTELMTLSGYIPTDAELAAAGMTKEQADYYIRGWKAANPDLAYRTGAITAEEYYSYTGAYPPGYAVPVATSSSSGGGGSYYSGSSSSSKSSSSSGSGSYNLGELLDASGAGMSKSQMTQALSNRGVDVSSPAVQQDIKWALSK